MTDEQQKKIEIAAKNHADRWGNPALAKSYTTGAAMGMSLSKARTKELEDMLASVSGWLQHERTRGRGSHARSVFIERIENLLTPTDNEERKDENN